MPTMNRNIFTGFDFFFGFGFFTESKKFSLQKM